MFGAAVDNVWISTDIYNTSHRKNRQDQFHNTTQQHHHCGLRTHHLGLLPVLAGVLLYNAVVHDGEGAGGAIHSDVCTNPQSMGSKYEKHRHTI